MTVIPGHCKHFSGLSNKTCKAGVEYASVRDSAMASVFRSARFCVPCFDRQLPCEKREYPPSEGIGKDYPRIRHIMTCIRHGISPCCEAPLDNREVLTSGEFKGHGPRYCSKCGELVFMV